MNRATWVANRDLEPESERTQLVFLDMMVFKNGKLDWTSALENFERAFKI